jgi:hypothetical protein
MPEPVVYSAAATEPRAILNDDHAVRGLVFGSRSHVVERRQGADEGCKEGRDDTISGA